MKKAITPIIILVIFGIVIASAIVANNQMQATKPDPDRVRKMNRERVYKTTYTRPSTKAQPTTTDALEKQFSAWDGSHYKTVRHVKRIMKNPKSFKHVKTTYTAHKDKNYRVIVMQYRGTNSFNAVVTNTIFVQVKLNGDVVKVISQL